MQFNAALFAVYGLWAVGIAAAGHVVLGALAAFVLLELSLAAVRISDITGRVVTDERVAARMAPILDDLCRRAGCAAPRVVLRDDVTRAAAVRRRRRRGTRPRTMAARATTTGARDREQKVDLLLSRPFVDKVDDARLRALVAHELVHVVRHDLRFARRRGLVASIGGITLAVAAGIALADGFNDIPVSLAAAIVGSLAVNVLLSPLNRRREVRADVEGARLSGDPGALADALLVAHAQSNETRDRLFGHPPWRWILSPLSWRMPTHPRMATRIARLRSLAATPTP